MRRRRSSKEHKAERKDDWSNYVFDWPRDETHAYMINGSRFDVPSSCSVSEVIGQGAYGVVCAARYRGQPVAIKKIENVFEVRRFFLAWSSPPFPGPLPVLRPLPATV